MSRHYSVWKDFRVPIGVGDAKKTRARGTNHGNWRASREGSAFEIVRLGGETLTLKGGETLPVSLRCVRAALEDRTFT